MTIEQFQSYQLARPFRPYVIQLADGRSLRVDHPEFVAHRPNSRTVAVAVSDNVVESIDLLQVVSFRHANGSRTRRGSRE